MAEDLGDKTEAPTARRRAEAREQGNIARSPDLTAAVLLIGMLLLLKAWGPGLVSALRALVAEMLGGASLADAGTGGLTEALGRALVAAGGALLPLLLGVMALAVGVNVLQVGLFFNPKRLQPNLGALNPAKGLGRMFGQGKQRTFVQLAMNVLKLVLVAAVAYSAVHGRIEQIVGVQVLTLAQIFGLGAEVVFAIGIRIGVLLLVLAVLDYAYQRWRVEQELKMTKQEVKDEMRRMDGDPRVKQRRRQIAVQMATQRLRKDVPTADVVVTNPTEFAVALKYDGDAMHAPRVIAKGQDLMAMRIREIAIASGVPILERKPLARALYKLVDVGQEIPEQFYAAVAEILAYVYELSGKAKRRAAV
jgi:flagellar biosynthetic protein FlhB